ncbi:MAG: arginine decarboxylase, pyruvoyl-dependent [Sedimentisphaerales bacterium]|nr:arginine decarboxylase, pyruvoyl-dependent [Sedimentisphaerales bacterium]
MIPKEIFFTRGVGRHRLKLQSFEGALRDAGIAICNLVSVSSIFPAGCKIIPCTRGVQKLQAGEITHVVMARSETDEPGRRCCAGVGLAVPAVGDNYGYISEFHGYGKTAKEVSNLVEDMAATMLATTLGIEFDPNKAYDERKEIYRMSGKIVTTRAEVQVADAKHEGEWTTVVAAAVFIPERRT